MSVKLTKVEQIADYAYRAKFEDLSNDSLQQIPVHILDSLGCQIAALGANPVNFCRNVIKSFSPTGSVPLIAGGTSSPIYAAFWHTALVRYVDAMDNILAPTETAHTADNFGGILTAAVISGATGKDLMLGVAIGWSVQSLLVEHANFMSRGLDHTSQLAFSVPAAVGKLLGMDKKKISHAIAMAASSDASFAGIRAKPLSEWKGIASAQSTLSAFNAIYLAKEGLEGPLNIIEGPNGVEHLLGKTIDIDWAHANYEGVTTSTIKKYVAMIHTQSAIECILQLTYKHSIDPKEISCITAEVPQITFDFAGGGLYGGAIAEITTKEQADHSLPYLLAVAVLDKQVMQPQFTPARIASRDVQELLKKVVVKANSDYTKRYPAEFCTKITIELNTGGELTHEVTFYPGMPSHPFTWNDCVEKFDKLTHGYIDSALANELKDLVKNIQDHTVTDLFEILSKIKYPNL